MYVLAPIGLALMVASIPECEREIQERWRDGNALSARPAAAPEPATARRDDADAEHCVAT
jgi:hypothetical protein